MHWFERLLSKVKPLSPLPRAGKGGIDPGGVVLYSNGDKSLDVKQNLLFQCKFSEGPFATTQPVYLLNMLSSFASTDHKQAVRGLIIDGRAVANLDDLDALLHSTGAFIPKLAKGGRIVVLASSFPSSSSTFSDLNLSPSICEGFVRSLAKEVGGSMITCNLVVVSQPSPTPAGRKTGPESLSLPPCVNYLLSGSAAFVTSQRLDVDVGGAGAPTADAASSPSPLPLAVVTGASRGIGAHVVRLLSRDFDVLSVDLSFPTAGSPFDHNGRLELDVSDPSAGLRLTAALSDLGLTTTSGGRRRPVSVVVHAAGITLDKTLRKMAFSDYKKVMDVNLRGVVAIDDALLKGGLLADGARVVCVSSTSGVGGNFGQVGVGQSHTRSTYVPKHKTQCD